MSGDRFLREIANAEKRSRRPLRLPDPDAVEVHHIAGRATLAGMTVPFTEAAHRDSTDLQRILGVFDLPPADGDPLLLLAHVLTGIAVLLIVFGRWLVDYVAARAQAGAPPPFPVVP